jgi:hypothetical protein
VLEDESTGRARPGKEVSSTVPRLCTIAQIGLVVVLADVTWDGESLRISVGLPGRRRIIQLVFPVAIVDRGSPASDSSAASSFQEHVGRHRDGLV